MSVSDESGQMAFPEVVLSNDSDLLKNLVALIEDKGVEEVVVGHSLNRDGSENKIHSEVEELMEDLTLELGLPIHLEPEQYSTKEAEQIQGRNDMVDASAATIILNSYITKKKI